MGSTNIRGCHNVQASGRIWRPAEKGHGDLKSSWQRLREMEQQTVARRVGICVKLNCGEPGEEIERVLGSGAVFQVDLAGGERVPLEGN